MEGLCVNLKKSALRFAPDGFRKKLRQALPYQDNNMFS